MGRFITTHMSVTASICDTRSKFTSDVSKIKGALLKDQNVYSCVTRLLLVDVS